MSIGRSFTNQRVADSLAAAAGVPEHVKARVRSCESSHLQSLLNSTFDPAAVVLDEETGRVLRELNCAAVVPLRDDFGAVGFFAIGRKLTDRDYDQSELEFVAAVSERVLACLRFLEMDQETKRARAIQEALLPRTIPQIAGLQIAPLWQPARNVGGDYYDVLRVADDLVAVCIRDVVGKGLPAALMMANLQAAVRTRASASTAPSVLCREVNQLMAANLAPDKFITFFYGSIDSRNRRFTYSNAGHNHPVLLRNTGEIQRLGVGGPVLGVIPDYDYDQHVVELCEGDRVLMFTDGASEVWNSDDQELGEDGLIALFARAHHLATDDVPPALLKDISSFAGGNFSDDVTLVVISIPHL